MNPYQYLEDLAQALAAIPQDSIVSRTLYQDGAVRMILFGFAPGQELSEHTTPMAATLHFLTGPATVTLGADHLEVAAGAWIQMPPKLPHSVRAHAAPVVMLLTMVTQAK